MAAKSVAPVKSPEPEIFVALQPQRVLCGRSDVVGQVETDGEVTREAAEQGHGSLTTTAPAGIGNAAIH